VYNAGGVHAEMGTPKVLPGPESLAVFCTGSRFETGHVEMMLDNLSLH